jgi:hypothetical protein
MDTGVSDAPLLGIIMYAACKIRGKSDIIIHPTILHHIYEYCRIRELEFTKTTIYFLHA